MPARTVTVEGKKISFNIEPFMVGDKRKGYRVAETKLWNAFRISTMTKADAVISELIKGKIPKGTVVVDVPVSPGKRRGLNAGERERIVKRAKDAGDTTVIEARGAIPADVWAKFNDDAWMRSNDSD